MKNETLKQEALLHDLEFTMHAKRAIVKTARDPYFRDRDPELILRALMDEIRSVSFGDYLKRYILGKKDYQDFCDGAEKTAELDYLCEAFRKNGVPPSFSPTTAKVRALAKNWLGQRVVSRSVVLLLGFALEMAPCDVNDFLVKALKESKINPKDPFEVICWYCYQFRFPYSKYQELWDKMSEETSSVQGKSCMLLENTVHVRKDMESIRNEIQLLDYLSKLNLVDCTGRQSIAARKQFDELYRSACTAIADMKTEMEREDAGIKAIQYRDKLSRNDRIFDFQRNERIRKAKETYHRYTAEEITPADLESILYSAIPKDRNGNLIPMKESLLNIHFSGKRLNRQHISDILDGKGMINRFDIITLSFFVTAKETEKTDDIRSRYDLFIKRTNNYLLKSDMEPIYVTNPYESFVLMCILTDDPLGTFSDVWELSYEV